MDRFLSRALRLLAAQLVVLTAVIHLSWGLPRAAVYLDPAALELYLSTSAFPDPRPVLFVLSGSAVAVGLVAAWRGYLSMAQAYRLGIAMMAVYVVGWVVWHTTGHGQLLFGEAVTGVGGGHQHQAGLVATIVDHIVTLPLEAASKSAEVGAIALFLALLRGDPDVADDDRFPW
ncbi:MULTISPECIES: hypothetical protein [Salinibaculum]|uniref:hypothetical protein n=1 Tax=Salinibaculum TaxID=2732368 RepID=UPI0030CBC3D9